MIMVAKLLISCAHIQTAGQGITFDEVKFSERCQVFGQPIPLELATKLALTMLNPSQNKVRAFDVLGSVVGEWSIDMVAFAQLQKAQTAPETSKVKAAKVVDPARKAQSDANKRAKDLADLAKAPKAMLPFHKQGEQSGKTGFRGQADRWLSAVPCPESDTNVFVSLIKSNGDTAVIPVFKSLYTSAVSRGKALVKEDPTADELICVKRLMAELLLTDSMRTIKVEGEEIRVLGPTWVSAVLTSNKLILKISRDEAIECQKDLPTEVYKRQSRQVMSKRGASGQLSWPAKCKNDISHFSHG